MTRWLTANATNTQFDRYVIYNLQRTEHGSPYKLTTLQNATK